MGYSLQYNNCALILLPKKLRFNRLERINQRNQLVFFYPPPFIRRFFDIVISFFSLFSF